MSELANLQTAPEVGAELVQRAEATIELALRLGAEGARATAERGRSAEFRGFEGRPEKAQESHGQELSVALYVDGRYSTHATNDLDPARLERFLTQAVALTRQLEVDSDRELPDPELYAGRSEVDLDLVDPRVPEIGRDERITWLGEIEEAARGDAAVISASTMLVDGVVHRGQASSNGFSGSLSRTWLWYGATVTVADKGAAGAAGTAGTDRRPEASRFCGGAHIEDVPPRAQVGREACERALARRGAEKAPSECTKLVTSPSAGRGLLGRVFGVLSAGAVQQERSFLAKHRGQRVGSSLLTVVDDPLRPRGLGSRLYDGEGVSARVRDVFREGVLADYFVDTYYGKKLGWRPNGGSSSNLVFEHGSQNEAGLVAEAGSGFWVDSWLGGNANATTGDFSFGFAGRRIVGGKLAEPVSEMNVTGNYLELLDRLVAVGNDPEPWAVCRTPTCVFEGVQFSGR